MLPLMRGWAQVGQRRCGRKGASRICSPSSKMCGSWCFPRFLFRGRVFDSDKHGLPYGPDDALGLPIHNGETPQLVGMTCGVGMVINRGGGS